MILIVEGSAEPVPEDASVSTALEAAVLPNLAALARTGRVGAAAFIPEGCTPDEEIAMVSAFGIEPLGAGITRGVLDAISQGVDIEPGSVVASVELITVIDRDAEGAGEILEPVSIPEREAVGLFDDLAAFWRGRGRNVAVHHVGGRRAVLIVSVGHSFRGVRTEVPVLGEAFDTLLPAGGIPGEADALAALVRTSHEFLREHEINLARVEQGLLPANLAWVTQPSPRPHVPGFKERTGLSACVVDRRGIAIGLARLLEIEAIVAVEVTLGDLARIAIEAIDTNDVVIVRITNTPLEAVDSEFVGPLLNRLFSEGNPEVQPATSAASSGFASGWRMLVMPTRVVDKNGMEHNDPVPIIMAGAWIRAAVLRRWTERDAAQSDLFVRHGHELMEYFLFGGLTRRPTRSRNRRFKNEQS